MVSSVFQAAARNLASAAGDSYIAEICRAIDLLWSCFAAGGKLLVFGNGGSSADSSGSPRRRNGIPAIALSANQAVLTAWSNDYSFETVFSRQIEALGRPGDVAWGVSTSGNSPNVVQALKVARERGLATVGLTGQGGGRMSQWCDVLMAAPRLETPRIQEVHLVTYHAICAGVELRLFPEKPQHISE